LENVSSGEEVLHVDVLAIYTALFAQSDYYHGNLVVGVRGVMILERTLGSHFV